MVEKDKGIFKGEYCTDYRIAGWAWFFYIGYQNGNKELENQKENYILGWGKFSRKDYHGIGYPKPRGFYGGFADSVAYFRQKKGTGNT